MWNSSARCFSLFRLFRWQLSRWQLSTFSWRAFFSRRLSTGNQLWWLSIWIWRRPYNDYSMSWIWSDKITNERVARVGYNHFISNKGEWNNCLSKFSNRVLPPIFISTILQSVRKENLAHYFPYDVKLGILADSRSFLANQKARNAIVGAENLLKFGYFS